MSYNASMKARTFFLALGILATSRTAWSVIDMEAPRCGPAVAWNQESAVECRIYVREADPYPQEIIIRRKGTHDMIAKLAPLAEPNSKGNYYGRGTVRVGRETRVDFEAVVRSAQGAEEVSAPGSVPINCFSRQKPEGPDYIPGELLVEFRPETGCERKHQLIAAVQGEAWRPDYGLDMVRFRGTADVKNIDVQAEKLRGDPHVALVSIQGPGAFSIPEAWQMDCQAPSDCLAVAADCCHKRAEALSLRHNADFKKLISEACRGTTCGAGISHDPSWKKKPTCRQNRCTLDD